MKHPHDHIVVGIITLPYSIILAGWIMPDGSVIHNPVTAQNVSTTLTVPFTKVHQHD